MISASSVIPPTWSTCGEGPKSRGARDNLVQAEGSHFAPSVPVRATSEQRSYATQDDIPTLEYSDAYLARRDGTIHESDEKRIRQTNCGSH
jgi:hypothetical protein